MNLTKRHTKIISAVVLLTSFLTCFFYAHETLPKPIRAATALIETPAALASGLSHYLKLGVDVYETPWAVILTNLVFSVAMVLLVDKFLKIRKRKLTVEIDSK
jgi:ABC-type multidrug transport system permease subunit